MTSFFLLASLLVILALLMLLPSMLRAPKNSSPDQFQANIKIARERQATLRLALQDGGIEQSVYDQEVRDLERTLATEISTANANADSSRGRLFGAAIIVVFVPIAAGALYLFVGTPGAINVGEQIAPQTDTNNQSPQSAPSLTALIPQLEQRLAASPDDALGWDLLGRTYFAMDNYEKSTHAWQRAFELDAQNPNVLAQLAESIAMQRSGSLSGEPRQYLTQALLIDPNHEQSIWLMAIADQQMGDHQAALIKFRHLLTGVAGNATAMDSINQMMALSLQELGQTAATPNKSDTSDNNNTAPDKGVESAASSTSNRVDSAQESIALSVSVTLDPNLAKQISPDLTVFVYARASNGPPMPLAVARRTVSELPFTVTLDESMALLPDLTLASFPTVTVGARISQTGNAIAQAGDWYGDIHNQSTSTSDALAISINQQK